MKVSGNRGSGAWWWPLSVALLGTLATGAVVAAFVTAESAHLRIDAEQKASDVARYLSMALRDRVEALRRYTDRLAAHRFVDWEAAADDRANYLADFPSLAGLVVVEDGGRVRFADPEVLREFPGGEVGAPPPSAERKLAFFEPPAPNPDGRMRLRIWTRSTHGDDVALAATFDLEHGLHQAISHLGLDPDRWRLEVHGGDRQVFAWGNPETAPDHRAVAPLLYGPREPRVAITPTAGYLAERRSTVPVLIGVGGLVVTALLALLFHLFQVNRRRELREHRTAEDRMRMAAVEQSLERMTMAVEAAPNGMIMVEAAGKITMVNQALCAMFGYSREELVGESVEKLVPEAVRPYHPQLRRDYLADPRPRFMGAERYVEGVGADGTTFPVEIGLNPVRFEGGMQVLASVVDITERQFAEERLRHYTEELERRNRELDDFAYIVSHDLRAPLRGIDHISQWLHEDLGDSLTGESRRHLELMADRVHRMERLLTDVLTYSRAGRTESEPEPVEPFAMTREIWELLTPPAGFALEVAGDEVPSTTLRVPLETVVRNLVANAIKHHDRDRGEVRVEWRRLPHEWEIRVGDDGPGIRPEYHEKVFRMFQALEPGRDGSTGTGVGLAVVKKIVDNLHGRIDLLSDESRGTEFTVHWPLPPLTSRRGGRAGRGGDAA